MSNAPNPSRLALKWVDIAYKKIVKVQNIAVDVDDSEVVHLCSGVLNRLEILEKHLSEAGSKK